MRNKDYFLQFMFLKIYTINIQNFYFYSYPMQINVFFSFEKDQQQPFDASILQWLIYTLLDKQLFDNVHASSYGLFSFSNIIPFIKNTPFKAGNRYSFTIKSIDKKIIYSLFESLSICTSLEFGRDNQLLIKKVFITNADPYHAWKLIQSVTPILLSLDENLCRQYSLVNERMGKPLFWNEEMGFDIFVKQLQRNIMNKYVFLLHRWYITSISDFDRKLLNSYPDKERFDEILHTIDLFKGYKFRRGAMVDYKGGKLAGSLRDFIIADEKNSIKILNNVSSIGFWERATAGFWYIK